MLIKLVSINYFQWFKVLNLTCGDTAAGIIAAQLPVSFIHFIINCMCVSDYVCGFCLRVSDCVCCIVFITLVTLVSVPPPSDPP